MTCSRVTVGCSGSNICSRPLLTSSTHGNMIKTNAVSQFRVCIHRSTLHLRYSFRETLLASSAIVKWDGLTLEHFLVASPDVLPLRHDFPWKWRSTPRDVAIFVLSSFTGTQRVFGYLRLQRIVVVHPSKTGKRRIIWRSLQIGQPSDGVVM